MLSPIRIEKSNNDFTKQQWGFYLDDDLRLHFREYKVLQRETKRHKFQVATYYSSYNKRDSKLKREDVPIPLDVIESAIEQVRSMISYKAD